jgi:hypothetical protein
MAQLHPLIALLLVSGCAFNDGHGNLTVVNHSGETSTVTVDVASEHYVWPRMLPDATRHVTFNVPFDTDYSVIAVLRDGRIVSKHLGYLTNGLDTVDTIVVTNRDIELNGAAN